jgi:hypothetical protein
MQKVLRKASDLVVLTAALYRELAVSALGLIPRPANDIQEARSGGE